MCDEILFRIEFDKSPIPDKTFRRLDEVRVSRDGCVWSIHKCDADPFPSNPHAHNVESGLKLDLSNGRLWFRSRDTKKNISVKNLLVIRSEAEKRGVKLPNLAV